MCEFFFTVSNLWRDVGKRLPRLHLRDCNKDGEGAIPGGEICGRRTCQDPT
jgi:hypothetical protein